MSIPISIGTALAVWYGMNYDAPAAERKKSRKRSCAGCGNRIAKFKRSGGTYKTDSQHDLCARCWRSLTDKDRNQNLVSKTNNNNIFSDG